MFSPLSTPSHISQPSCERRPAKAKYHLTELARCIPLQAPRSVPRFSLLGQPKNANADCLQPRHVHYFAVVQVIDLAVCNKKEVGFMDSSRCRQNTKIGAIFEHGRVSHAQPIARKVKGRQARRADAVLDRDQAAVVPIETVDACERASRSRIHVAALPACEIYVHHSQAIRNVQGMIVRAKSNPIRIKKRSMKRQRLEPVRQWVETKHRVRQAIRGNHFPVSPNDQIVEAMLPPALWFEAS